jgi:hypothetical protein
MLSVAIIGLFCIPQVGMAMKKEIKTSLSSKEEAELRRAVIDYKKNKSRSTQEQIINKYAKKYPNDALVKAKLNEKSKFDQPHSLPGSNVISVPDAPIQTIAVPASPMYPMPVNQKTYIYPVNPNIYIYNDTNRVIRVTPIYEDYNIKQSWETYPQPQSQLAITIRPYETSPMTVHILDNDYTVYFGVDEIGEGGNYKKATGGSLKGTHNLPQGDVAYLTFGDGVKDGNSYLERETLMPVRHLYETSRVKQ